MILKLLASGPTMLKCSIQQYKRTKQRREIGKHQQFESLGGNISPAAVQPINQANQESQQEPNRETLSPPSVCLICPSGAQTNGSAPQTTQQIFFW